MAKNLAKIFLDKLLPIHDYKKLFFSKNLTNLKLCLEGEATSFKMVGFTELFLLYNNF